MKKRKIYDHNPTNLKEFNDITDDETHFLKTLKTIWASIQTGVDKKIIGGNYHSLLQSATSQNVRVDWIKEKLIQILTRSVSTNADRIEAEQLLVAYAYGKLHNRI